MHTVLRQHAHTSNAVAVYKQAMPSNVKHAPHNYDFGTTRIEAYHRSLQLKTELLHLQESSRQLLQQNDCPNAVG